MKTQGVTIVDGTIVVPWGRAVIPAFWARLQHHIAKAGLVDEFAADRVRGEQGTGLPWEREERLFRRWVERLDLVGPLWPWERGWTQEKADAYLDSKREAA